MTEFTFAKELGKLEAQFEAMTAKYEAKIQGLEEENAVLLEAMTSFEDKFGGVEELKSAIEMIQKHIESMSPSEEMTADADADDEEKKEEEMAMKPKEKYVAPADEEAKDLSKEEEKEEDYEAVEEEVTENEVEEQFAAEQKAEEQEEQVEDKTVSFDAITPEKVAMINNFFNRK